MSVATKNPFAILDPEDPPRPPSPVPPPVDPPQVAEKPSRGNQKPRGGPASRGGRYYSRGAANKGVGRDQNTEDASAPLNPEAAPRKFDNDGRGRGRGRGRGGSRGGTGSARGRQFDRHSQSGKTDSDKKVHQAWGGDDGNAELKFEEAANNDAATEGANDWGTPQVSNDWGDNDAVPADDPWSAPVTTTTEPAPTSPVAQEPDKSGRERDGRRPRDKEPEEEDNTLTLDQYLAQKKESEAVPKLEGTRKANEGQDDNWKDVVPLKKDEEQNTYFVGKSKSAAKPRAKKEEKVFIEINPHFDRPSRGRGRGGDRGGDRPYRGTGRGRGAPRGRPNGSVTVNVDDESAFPSLS